MKWNEALEVEIRNNLDLIKWDIVSMADGIPEAFIREFKDKLDWSWLSASEGLSEPFIREMKDYVYWNMINRFQNVSESFKREFKKEIAKSELKEAKINYSKNHTKIKGMSGTCGRLENLLLIMKLVFMLVQQLTL